MKKYEDSAYRNLSCDWHTSGAICERPCVEHMLEVQRSQVSGAFREWLATWPTHDLSHKMLYLAVSKMLPSYPHPHYISPHYPQNCKESI